MTFESDFDASFDEARISNLCSDFVDCGALQGAGEAMYRCYVHVKRLKRQYREVLQLVENVNDDAATSDNAAGKIRLGITYLNSDLVL